jgi:hypothetical protein
MGFHLFKLLFLFLFTLSAYSSEYYGRASVGSFLSSERYTTGDSGSDKNDFLNMSGRLYFRFYDITPEKIEVVTDIRDKYDQFNQLNKTQLQLDPKNYFQLRTMHVTNFQSQRSLQFIAGRFSSLETGGTFTDGGGIQYKINSDLRVGVISGLNPMSEDTQMVGYNSKATILGFYSAYEPKDTQASVESKNLFFNHAFVSQRYAGEEDRRYFYQNIYYQWSAKSRLLSSLYLDFLPKPRLQNWNINWDQDIGDKNVTHLQLLDVDSIEYRRRQGIRETLPSSSYEQVTAQIDLPLLRISTFSPAITYGKRMTDGYTKMEAKVKAIFNDLDNKNYDANAFVGIRKNFTSNDAFLGAGFGYYVKKIEFTSDFEFAKEQHPTQVLTPIILTFNGSYIQSRDLFYSTSLELARDEIMSKFAVFFKLTYRFGTKEITPLRDGAPKRGTL